LNGDNFFFCWNEKSDLLWIDKVDDFGKEEDFFAQLDLQNIDWGHPTSTLLNAIKQPKLFNDVVFFLPVLQKQSSLSKTQGFSLPVMQCVRWTPNGRAFSSPARNLFFLFLHQREGKKDD